MDVRFRPLPVWTRPETSPRRSRWTFKASWSDTLELLQRELHHLDASGVVIGAALREQDIRMDGWPRSNARQPTHPGVEISFTTPNGNRLVYATDSCEDWQHNVRSIALGLEALRAVDRYGITSQGEQYAGFKQLAAGSSRGEDLVHQHGSVTAALKATHPDRGGDREDFEAVQAYRQEQGL